MRAIVTGTGSIAIRHVRNLRQLLPDAAIALVTRPGGSGVPAAIAPLITEHHTDLAAALERPADIAIIATPAPFHVAQARQMIEHGVATLIEKPLSASVDGCQQLLELSEAKGVQVLVGYCLRYHPLVMEMQRLVASNAIGRIYTIRAEVGQYLPGWRPDRDYRKSVSAQKAMGGGALLELSHEIDLVRSLVGMPGTVTAVTAKLSELEIDVEDVAEIVLGHRPDGADVISSIHLDLFRRLPRRRLTIDGSEGHLELDLGEATLTRRGLEGEALVQKVPPDFTINDLYMAEVKDLLACRTGGSQPLAGLADGLATLKIVLAAVESARERRTVACSS